MILLRKVRSSWHQPNILPLGDATINAAAALNAVKAKMDDYFTRCRLAAFDPRALEALDRQELEYLEIAARSYRNRLRSVRIPSLTH